jgi:hypothetical protein
MTASKQVCECRRCDCTTRVNIWMSRDGRPMVRMWRPAGQGGLWAPPALSARDPRAMAGPMVCTWCFHECYHEHDPYNLAEQKPNRARPTSITVNTDGGRLTLSDNSPRTYPDQRVFLRVESRDTVTCINLQLGEADRLCDWLSRLLDRLDASSPASQNQGGSLA